MIGKIFNLILKMVKTVIVGFFKLAWFFSALAFTGLFFLSVMEGNLFGVILTGLLAYMSWKVVFL